MPKAPPLVLLDVARRAWRRTGELTASFFSADAAAESTDPLLDLVERDQVMASRFIKATMSFSSVGGLLISIICFVFLMLFWTRCGGCNRPLRWWLLVHAVLQLMQVPVRIVFLARLRDVVRNERSIEECVRRLTASPAWRATKKVSFATYVWFVFGVVWTLNGGGCESCPGIYRLMVVVILQAVARIAVGLCTFRALLQPVPEGPKVEVADPAVVAALPLVTCSRGLFDSPGESCAVCLCEFAEGEDLRKLPCDHYFHRKCVDQWLGRSCKCPLCMQRVDGKTETTRQHQEGGLRAR